MTDSFSQAIRLTQTIIQRRTHYYRNLIILTVFITLTVMLWACLQLSGYPLVILLFLFPLYGFFTYLDNQLVNYWRQQLLTAWGQHQLDLPLFIETLLSLRHLPPQTVTSMLNTLPSKDLASVSVSLRQALRFSLSYTYDYHNQHRLFKTLNLTIIIMTCSLALVLWSGLAGFVVLLIPLFSALNSVGVKLKLNHYQQQLAYLSSSEWEQLTLVASRLELILPNRENF
ncbi:MAG: hypothetical protein SVR94_01540 [Pseudomonadota bacterium]|nr:hypothetical protein [Pseudomonadota bacterium]